MKASFIATVFNEEETIDSFLKSIFQQSRLPDEITIVDGGSTDATAPIISNFKSTISNKKTKFKLIVKKGNRSVGRNRAIENTENEIIACSDAGCILDKDWFKNIIEPFKDPKTDVVAGYYKGIAETTFQRCLIPYVLVMSDKINPNTFLPATRSMAFAKSIWKKAGKFDEKLSHNEDYAFAKKLKKINAKIVFEKNAVANWIPKGDVENAFVMFYRFAKGDAESRICRTKVFLIFLRYFIGLFLVALYIAFKLKAIIYILPFLFFVYVLWSITKSFKYVGKISAILILPLLQLMSDVAVIAGTTSGFCSLILQYNKIRST